MLPSSVLADSAIVESIRHAPLDDDIRRMFLECLTNTLDTTVHPLDDDEVFIVTGDIPAMWLRDSTTQLAPYLVLMRDEPRLHNLVLGVLKRQLRYIGIDPYANAFNREANAAAHDPSDLSDDPWVWERKYEVDSLAFPLHLAFDFWRITGRTDHFDGRFRHAARRILRLWRTEQDHENGSDYRFVRADGPQNDTLVRDGRGSPVAVTGMTWSGFRPSDDACEYGYNIPANLFASSVLDELSRIGREVIDDESLAQDATALRAEILLGIATHGIVDHPTQGRIYAYETDGHGNHLLIDDANMPSLLSLPLLGVCDPQDELYAATLRFALSRDNPYFYSGSAARGIGSPHTPPDYVWHIGIAVEGLTTTSRADKIAALRMMADTDAGTGMMHEGFHKDDPTRYTRPWFSWANAMFCLLVLDVCGYPATGPWPETA